MHLWNKKLTEKLPSSPSPPSKCSHNHHYQYYHPYLRAPRHIAWILGGVSTRGHGACLHLGNKQFQKSWKVFWKKINIVSTSAHLYLCHKSMKESSNIFEIVLKNVSRNILNTLGSCGLGGPCILQLLYIPAWIRSMSMSWFLNKWE